MLAQPEPQAQEPATADKFSIVLFSGTDDKIMAAVTMATGAAAMGKKVTLFLTFGGLMAFRKDAWKSGFRFSKDLEPMAEAAMSAMRAKNVPHWMQTLKEATEIGQVEVKACGMTMDLFDLKLTDLEPIVSEVTGVASFVQASEGGTTLFI
ncbi:MAG TPA: DsrE/DsrF/DrsH-like family protein [Candidatus Nitrosotenuis sp.]|jgi:peroxiredoxin family protein|nr:DsrE/DsrF/DrsH-like family protein [Candidatus Nitrosotenuis sp.]